METTLVNYQANGFLLLGKEIMNPAYIVHVADRGMVHAYKAPWSKGEWVETYHESPNEESELVRCVTVQLSENAEGSISYYGDKAEAIWNYFAAIAFPLMENLTLDSQS